jgi:hypothetical protein
MEKPFSAIPDVIYEKSSTGILKCKMEWKRRDESEIRAKSQLVVITPLVRLLAGNENSTT